MSPKDYRAALAALGITQARLSRILESNKATTNRWSTGFRPVPRSIELLLQAWRAHPELIPEAPDNLSQ
jgi:hypothetical protein